MNKTTGIAAFIFGAAVGSVATWYFAKKYYAKIAQEEIDSVKEVFSKKQEKTEERDYSAVLNNCGYSNKEKEVTPVIDEHPPVYEERPYVIDPEEFGDIFQYEQIELTYYADGVLTDDFNEPIENIDELVGSNFAEYFGEYEDDAVYIRNDKTKSDYAILKDERNHTEVIRYKQNEVEME